MTCRGYDSKAVKISKSIKMRAASILDKQQRRDYIRTHVQMIEENARAASQASKSSNKKSRKKNKQDDD